MNGFVAARSIVSSIPSQLRPVQEMVNLSAVSVTGSRRTEPEVPAARICASSGAMRKTRSAPLVLRRSRIYDTNKVKAEELSTYEELTDPKWKKRILIRSSNNIYNQSLVASLIHNDGPEGAQAWCNGIVANMARPPKGGDIDQINALVDEHTGTTMPG